MSTKNHLGSKILFRLIPHKHVRFCDSIVAIAGLLKQIIDKPMRVDEVWIKLKDEIKKQKWPVKYVSFETVWVALIMLYALNVIEKGEEDIIYPKT